jgi:PAS domain-containing protein
MASLLDQDLYRLAPECLPVGICVVNREDKVCLWSAGAERLTGHLCQDVLGRHCREEFLQHVDAGEPALATSVPLLETIREGHSLLASASLDKVNPKQAERSPSIHPWTEITATSTILPSHN